jgi:hypothetical protein
MHYVHVHVQIYSQKNLFLNKKKVILIHRKVAFQGK